MLKQIFIISCAYILLVGFKENNETDTPKGMSDYEDVQDHEIQKPISEVLGVTHVGGKYHFTNKTFLKEGADTIKYLGTKVIKLWFSRTSSTSMQDAYYYNSTWPTNIRSLKELAQTNYFMEIFSMPFKTFVLEAMDVSSSYWKNGMTPNEQLAVQSEFYELTKYLLETYKNLGKTFILQNWEGDNALNAELIAPENLHLAIDGMTKWCNARQDGVTKARKEVVTNDVTVAHCFEMNFVLPNLENVNTNVFVVDSVVPYTYSDLYSLSSWGTRLPGEEKNLTEKLNYIAAKAPDSNMYGSKNVMLGEFGQYEISGWDPAVPFNSTSGNLQKTSVSNQIKYATEWGVPYLIYWEIFCNGLRADVTYNPGDNLTNNQLKGVWLIRADGTYTPTWNYFRTLFSSNLLVKTQRPIENQTPTHNTEIKPDQNILKIISKHEQGTIELYCEHKKIESVLIYDITGLLCLNSVFNGSTVDVSNLSKGLYILFATLENKEKISDIFFRQ